MKNKLNKKILILSVIAIILFVSLVFTVVQNFGLKNEVEELEKTMNDVSMNTLNDFNLFLIDKVEKCEAVTLMVNDKSVTVNNIHCE